MTDWLNKTKVWLGILDEEDIAGEGAPRAAKRVNPRDRDGHQKPSLDGFEAAPQEALEDALIAREAGDKQEMRRLLKLLDRGRGLRLVFNAAAAMEANDEPAVKGMLAQVAAERPAWKLPLQLSMALVDDKPRA